MAGRQLLTGRRGARLGGAIIVAGLVIAFGWRSDYFSGNLPFFSQISTSAFRIEAAGYPVRIVLDAPRPISQPSKALTSDDHSPKVNEPASEQMLEETPGLAMQLPVGGQLRGNGASGAEHPQVDGLPSGGGSSRLLKLNFSLAAGDQDDQINTKKKIDINDVDSGMVSIRISGDSDISISTRDLIEISNGRLSDRAVAALRNSEYIGFGELRSLGLIIRYDAVRDRMLLSSGSV